VNNTVKKLWHSLPTSDAALKGLVALFISSLLPGCAIDMHVDDTDTGDSLFDSASSDRLVSRGQVDLDGNDYPNVLFIIVDDLRPEVATYGDSLARTPSIDELANESIVFENAYASVPNCGASRASLFSSKRPTANRFLTYDSRLDEDLPSALSLPGYFKSHGYHTVSNGKVYDATMDSVSGWSETPWNPEGGWTSSMARNERRDDIQRAYRNNPDGVVGPAFERMNVPDDAYPDGKLTQKVINDLKRLSQVDKPFFITAGFRKPHLPFTAPEKYWSLYKPSDFELPITYSSIPVGAPYHPLHKLVEIRSYAGVPEDGVLSESQALNLIHAYHAAVSYADAQIGMLLDALDKLDLTDNTIVVLFGDNGMNLGDHSMWGKNALFDITLKTPLLIRAPGYAANRVKSLASLIDLFPTLTALAGLPIPEELDGVSLAPVMADPNKVARTAVISRWFDSASVRTQRYRYTDWRDEDGVVKARMLTDLHNDPKETRNVSEFTEYAPVVDKLSQLITADKSGDYWAPRVRDFVLARDGLRDSTQKP